MILGYSIIQLPEMFLLFWGFIKNWIYYVREKMGRIQPARNIVNALEDSKAHGDMVNIQPQEGDDEIRMIKENCEWLMNTVEKMESRLNSIEGHKECTIQRKRDYRKI